MISWYFSPHRRVGRWDRQGFLQLLKDVRRFRWYLRETPPGTPAGSQHGLGKTQDGNGDRPLPSDWNVDFLMRFESLQEDFDRVCQCIGIASQRLPHRNQSQRGDYRAYYDQELVERVAEKFADEISFGEYVFSND